MCAHHGLYFNLKHWQKLTASCEEGIKQGMKMLLKLQSCAGICEQLLDTNPINHYWKQTLMHASAAVQTSPPLRSLLNAMASNNASSQSSLTVLLTQPACLLPVSPASYVAGLTLSSADKGLALKCVWFSTSQHCPRQTLAPPPHPRNTGKINGSMT